MTVSLLEKAYGASGVKQIDIKYEEDKIVIGAIELSPLLLYK